MTDKERKERDDLKMEIKARDELIKRLQFPLKLIREAARKEKDKRAAKIEKASQYRNYEDAQDAYGWGIITEEEFDAIVKAMELGEEYVENTTTPVEVAARMLEKYVGLLHHEKSSFEFDILPPEEKERLRKKNEEIMEKREARKRGEAV